MKITMVEPYFTGSHRAWAQGYAAHSMHDVEIISLPGRFWKWRMHGGAVTLAREFLLRHMSPDLIVSSSMLDLSTFLSLTRRVTAGVPVAAYFHENQLAYPWQESDRDRRKGRDVHYGFINFITALTADRVFFNSHYNMESFLDELPRMLKHFPDYQELECVREIAEKSSCLYVGVDFSGFLPADAPFGTHDKSSDVPVIVWNHRWEYDKNPAEFFDALLSLACKGLDFRVILLGESFRQKPQEFLHAISRLGSRVLHAGFVKDRAEYIYWLQRANLLPVTSLHDFFGISVCEAIYSGCLPILPQRLAYTELVPPMFHQMVFYKDRKQFREMLEAEVRDWRKNRERRAQIVTCLQQVVSRFSWEQMAPEYDRTFASIIKPCRGALE